MKKLTIYHIDDQWFVYHPSEGVDVIDHEYIFDTFEEVCIWVENRYWELRAREEQ